MESIVTLDSVDEFDVSSLAEVISIAKNLKVKYSTNLNSPRLTPRFPTPWKHPSPHQKAKFEDTLTIDVEESSEENILVKNLFNFKEFFTLIRSIDEIVAEIEENYTHLCEVWKSSRSIRLYSNDIKLTLQNVEKTFETIESKQFLLLSKKKYSSTLKHHQVLLQSLSSKLFLALSRFNTAAQSLPTVENVPDNSIQKAFAYFYGILRPKNFSKAFSSFLQLSLENNSDAMFMLYECYRLGCGVDKSEEKAQVWLLKAIELENVNARIVYAKQYVDSASSDDLRLRYASFLNMSPKKSLIIDTNEVFSSYQVFAWLFECVRNPSPENVEAATILGMISAKIDNYEEAFHRYEYAANQGSVAALNLKGMLYFNGQGVICQPEIAFQCFIAAARGGEVDGYNNAGVCYEQGIGCDKSILDAIYCYHQAASQGHAQAMYGLGYLILRRSLRIGEILLENYSHAMEMCQGLWRNLVDRSLILYSGSLTERRDMEYLDELTRVGIHWLQKAAENGLAEASFQLGQLYEIGSPVVHIDLNCSFNHYDMAAKRGHSKAALYLGNMYYSGQGVEKDITKAFDAYLEAAIEGKIPEAMNALGILLEDGGRVIVDEPTGQILDADRRLDLLEAAKWYYDAAMNHNYVESATNLASLLAKNTALQELETNDGTILSYFQMKENLLDKFPPLEDVFDEYEEIFQQSLLNLSQTSGRSTSPSRPVLLDFSSQ